MASSNSDSHELPTDGEGHKGADDEAQRAERDAFMQHQKNAARLTAPVEARTIVNNNTVGVLSTISTKAPVQDYPTGSVVQYVADPADGLPLLFISTIAQHTKDILQSSKASITITRSGFTGMNDGRIALVGNIVAVPEDQRQAAREAYLARLPESFWVDFGDFAPYKMDLVVGSYNYGFGRAGVVTPEQYKEAVADPVAQFSEPVCSHMNDDHMDASVAIVKHEVGLDITEARMFSIDSLGVDMRVKHASGQSIRVRIPFKSPAPDRKAVKDRIVELTQAAKEAASAS